MYSLVYEFTNGSIVQHLHQVLAAAPCVARLPGDSLRSIAYSGKKRKKNGDDVVGKP